MGAQAGEGPHRQETQQGFSRASTRALAGPSGANWHRRVPERRGARPSLGVCPASAAPSSALRELAQRPSVGVEAHRPERHRTHVRIRFPPPEGNLMGGPSEPSSDQVTTYGDYVMRLRAMGERMAQCVGAEMTRQRP